MQIITWMGFVSVIFFGSLENTRFSTSKAVWIQKG
jgi:hypothetical protein